MSEKKSWDIQPRAKAPAQPQSAPPVRSGRSVQVERTRVQRKPASTVRRREAAPEPVAKPMVRRERVLQGRDREPLKAKRRRARRRMLTVLFIVFLIVLCGIFASFWSPAFRVQHVEASGPDATGVQNVAAASLIGTTDYVLPRNSIFFFSENALRTQVLAAYPDISAISVSRISFDTIVINSVSRESAFLWCGTTYVPISTSVQPIIIALATSTTSPAAPPIQSPCYDADSQGIVYSTDNDASPDTLRVYDSLASSSDSTTSPLGDYVSEASLIPNALELVKAIKSLDVPIVALAIRGDEADMYAQSGTRITYVLGTESTTANLAESAFPSLNLNDGSLAYVDLRFPGKVYFKKTGMTTVSTTTTYSAAVSCYLSGKCQIR